MYAGVPATVPGRLSLAWASSVVASSPSPSSACVSLARPKSRTLTTPSGVTITFAGLRSRWTMPAAWAAASASASGIAIRSTSPSRIPCAGDEGVQGLPGHELHHDEVDALGRLDLVDGDDVRVVEGGGGARLLHEAGAAGLVRQPLGGQHLDRHLAAEARVAGAVHLAHAARAEGPEDLVRAELRPGSEAHGDQRKFSIIIRSRRRPAAPVEDALAVGGDTQAGDQVGLERRDRPVLPRRRVPVAQDASRGTAAPGVPQSTWKMPRGATA